MTPKIIKLYVKPWCPWCIEAENWFKARGWEYERFNVTDDSSARLEMKELTGQTLAPSAEIDGHVIPDFDTGQLEHFLKQNGYDV